METVWGVLWLVPQAIAVVAAAEFSAGVVHWAEDAYGSPDTPIIGKWVIAENLRHHREPRQFLRKNWLQSSWDLLLAGAALVVAAWWFGFLTWHVWLFAILSANANQFHKWAHRTPKENPAAITWLQRRRIIQSAQHHARHHTDPKNSHYCVHTNFLNPILDGLGFWEALERFLERTVGLRRRPDPTVNPARMAARRARERD